MAIAFSSEIYTAELAIVEDYRSSSKLLEASSDIAVYGRFETQKNEHAFIGELAQSPGRVKLLFTIRDTYYGTPENPEAVIVIVGTESVEYRDWMVTRDAIREYKEAAERAYLTELAEQYQYYLNAYEAGRLPEPLFREIDTNYIETIKRIRGDETAARSEQRATTGRRGPPLISFDKDYVLYLEKEPSRTGSNGEREYRLLLGYSGVFTDLELPLIMSVYELPHSQSQD